MSETRPLKVGQRVRFLHAGRERIGIIRSFQHQDWAEEPVVILDLDPPPPGALGGAMGVRVEQDRVLGPAPKR